MVVEDPGVLKFVRPGPTGPPATPPTIKFGRIFKTPKVPYLLFIYVYKSIVYTCAMGG